MPRGGVILNGEVRKGFFYARSSRGDGGSVLDPGSVFGGYRNLDGRSGRFDHGRYDSRDGDPGGGRDHLWFQDGSPDGALRATGLRGRASCGALAFLLCLSFWVDLSWAVAPVLTSISPSSAVAGGAGFTLTLTGSGFVNPSSVLWDGAARPTTYTSSTSLTATIYTADLAHSGSKVVSVTGSTGTSGVKTFTISCGAPVLESMEPMTLVLKTSGYSNLRFGFSDDPACGPWSLWWSGLQQSQTSTGGWIFLQIDWALGNRPIGNYSFQLKNSSGLYSIPMYLEIVDDPFFPFLYILTGVMGAMAFIYGFSTRL